jgi:membrane protein
MPAMLGKLVTLVKETVTRWSEDRASTLAAALAYYAIFSIAPLLLIAVAVAGLVFGQRAAEGEIHSQLAGTVGETSARAVQRMVANLHQRPSGGIVASVAGIVTLLLAASGLFVQLQESMNIIWKAKARAAKGVLGFLRTRLVSFGMVMAIGLLLLLSLILSASLAAVGGYLTTALPRGLAVGAAVDAVVAFLLSTGLFAIIYKVLPDAEVAWRDVWLGAVVTSLLFTVGKIGIGFYLSRGNVASGYGAAGALVVLLLWIYYSAMILYLGAEFTHVYATHRRRG